MVPVSGSAYTYTYAVMGELLAWMVGWALILEYAVAASAVSVGWSGYFVGLLSSSLGIVVPPALASGPYAGGVVNLPALIIALLVTWRSEEHTSELQSLMRISYAVFCLKKKKKHINNSRTIKNVNHKYTQKSY